MELIITVESNLVFTAPSSRQSSQLSSSNPEFNSELTDKSFVDGEFNELLYLLPNERIEELVWYRVGNDF